MKDANKQKELNMSKKTIGIVLMAVGVIVVIVSLGADAMGIGNNAGLGWKQALGALVGVIAVAVGAWYWPGLPEARMPAEGGRAPASATGGTPSRKAGRATPARGGGRKAPAAKASRGGRRRHK